MTGGAYHQWCEELAEWADATLGARSAWDRQVEVLAAQVMPRRQRVEVMIGCGCGCGRKFAARNKRRMYYNGTCKERVHERERRGARVGQCVECHGEFVVRRAGTMYCSGKCKAKRKYWRDKG